jgi:hypothetical protein
VIAGDVVSHAEMCAREHGRMLQQGMHFGVSSSHSVLLMSRRSGAPYEDQVLDEGRTLIYEGHDVKRGRGVRDPKRFDQPRLTSSGKLTENGKFEKAAIDFRSGARKPELVRVYEKVKDGIWTYNGLFELVDAYVQKSGRRKVFKFRLKMVDSEVDDLMSRSVCTDVPHTRLIPSTIKREVFKRDQGRCVLCGATDNLHFDHDYPFSKGGTSLTAANIRLLCMRHNLAKSAKIE